LTIRGADSVAVNSIETVLGSAGTQTVTLLTSAAIAVSAVESVVGSAGVDTITLLSSLDAIAGGSGADYFDFSQLDLSSPVTLTISDFATGAGGDLVKLGNVLSGAGTYLGESASNLFTGTSGTHATSEQAYFDTVNMRIMIDQNGDGVADLIIKTPNLTGTLTVADNFLWN
jgi:hypothetical protein